MSHGAFEFGDGLALVEIEEREVVALLELLDLEGELLLAHVLDFERHGAGSARGRLGA